MLEIKSRSIAYTKRIARRLAGEIKKNKISRQAYILALEGDLGSGKTTFTQAFARALGIKEKITSPTFVLMKVYNLSPKTHNLRRFVHIDCYRLDSPKELRHLGFKNLLKDKDAIVAIEWADKIKKILPKDIVRIEFEHGKKPRERILKVLKFL